jgi:hypothetical protein
MAETDKIISPDQGYTVVAKVISRQGICDVVFEIRRIRE